jgi:hypothetical protein
LIPCGFLNYKTVRPRKISVILSPKLETAAAMDEEIKS